MANLHQVQRTSDIAVVEQMFGGEWRVLAYVGPGRHSHFVDYERLHGGGSLRVHYLKQES